MLGAGAAAVTLRPGPVDDWLGRAGWPAGAQPGTGTTAATPPEPPPDPVLAPADGSGPAPTPDGVRAALDPLVRAAGLGGRFGVTVVDVATGQTLYARGPDTLTVPASTTKVVTAAAVLATRGPAYRIPTRAVAGARPGEVVLVGGGDPTLAAGRVGAYPGAARLDALAAQVKKSLGGTAPARVTVDASLYSGPALGPAWDADIATGGYAAPITALMTDGGQVDPRQQPPAERFGDPDLAAGRAFAAALGLTGAAVRGVARGAAPAPPTAAAESPAGPDPTPDVSGAAPSDGPDRSGPAGGPPPGTELGRVESPPMLRLAEIMLAESDNVLAEALARQVALARGEPASYGGAAAAVDAVLAELGLPADESALADGSGLSRASRLTPSLLTDLLALAASGREPRLAGLFSGLPVAGWSGTLAGRFQAASGTGRAGVGAVRAKTGTLQGVNAMAGVAVTAQGRVLAFALLADGVRIGHWDAQAGLDAIAARLARCGCR
ncbi:MAG TPA: D-alanyl-D-alanine carboxypeptidase/D-alanyl-D-alanine-endopeptidase [Pilimelia sp.]|nr:D-alanyl-D-alanine carboxypeptidase/D-alanyl-D-alanine-endopeptidase [Pilimelia sp.]